jgi:hypothetical protein
LACEGVAGDEENSMIGSFIFYTFHITLLARSDEGECAGLGVRQPWVKQKCTQNFSRKASETTWSRPHGIPVYETDLKEM